MKRSAADAELADPGPFLRDYFYRHDMEGSAECSLSRELVHRAEYARDQFKRIRLDNSPESESDGATIGELKYNRRLANNRNSAAASRVFREVLKKEQEYALKRASVRMDKLSLQIERLEQRNKQLAKHLAQFNGDSGGADDKYQRENVELREKVAKLEAILQTDSTQIVSREEHTHKSTTLLANLYALESTDPGSPIEEEAKSPLVSLPPLQLGSMLPGLFSSSQNDKDYVRYPDSAPRNTITPHESMRSSQGNEAVGGAEPITVLSGVKNEETPQNLRLCMNASFPSGLLGSQGSFHLGITQESQQ